MEWPPGSKKIREFPEVDRGGWFELATARKKILTSQSPLLDELLRKLKKG
jgi:predicted NUDIX family NTP pyrophosphohydrolase